MNRNQAKTSISLGIAFNYIRIAIFLAVSLFYPPFLLSHVHEVNNGILTFAVSLLQVITLISLGTENSYVHFATQKEKEGREKLSSINGTYLILFGIIGLAIILCGVMAALLYRYQVFTIQEVPSASYNLVFWVILIISFSTGIDFFLSFFAWFEVFRNRFLHHQITLIVAKLLTVAFAMLALHFGEGILWVALITLMVQTAYGLVNLFFSLKVLKMPISFAEPTEIRRDLREIFRFSIFIFLVIAVSQIENNSGKIILSMTLGAGDVTVFSYGLEFYTYAALLSKGVSDTCAPKINALYIEGKRDEIKKTFLRASFLQMSVLVLLIGGFALAGGDFLLAWLGNRVLSDERLLQIYIIALASLLLWLVPLTESVGLEVQRVESKHKPLAIILFVLAAVSLIPSALLSIYLPNEHRIYGPLIGSAFFVVIGFWVISNVFYKKKFALPIGRYFLLLGTLLLLAGSLFAALFSVYEFLLPLDGLDAWVRFLIKGGSFALSFGLFYFLIFHKRIKQERQNMLVR